MTIYQKSFLCVILLSVLGCGSPDKQKAEEKIKEEVVALDSVNAAIESATEEVTKASEELDAALEDLDNLLENEGEK